MQLMFRQIQDIVCSCEVVQIRFHCFLFQNFDHHPSTSQWYIHIYAHDEHCFISTHFFLYRCHSFQNCNQ